jgi:hypothetical protein
MKCLMGVLHAPVMAEKTAVLLDSCGCAPGLNPAYHVKAAPLLVADILNTPKGTSRISSPPATPRWGFWIRSAGVEPTHHLR